MKPALKDRFRAVYERHYNIRVSDAVFDAMVAADEKKTAARVTLAKAINGGVVERKPCEVCGKPQSEGHHADYDQPLAVIWLCHRHHGQEHARFNRLPPSERAADISAVTARARTAMLQNIDHMRARNIIAAFL